MPRARPQNYKPNHFLESQVAAKVNQIWQIVRYPTQIIIHDWCIASIKEHKEIAFCMADLRILPQVLQMHLSGHSSNSKLFSRYLGWFLSRVIFGKWGVSPYGSENFILISKFSEASGAEKKHTYVWTRVTCFCAGALYFCVLRPDS